MVTRDITDREIKKRELREMIRAKAPNVRKKLETIISSDSEDPDFRADVIFMLGNNFPECFPTLLKLLEDKTQPLDVRHAVLGTIDDNKYSNGVQAAMMVVADRKEHRQLRTTAFEILAELDPIDGRSALFDAIKDASEDEHVRASLVFSLHPKYESDAQELLVQIASRREESKDVRAGALESLSDCTAVGNDLFMRIIRDDNEDTEVQRIAISELAKRPDGMGKAELLEIHRDESVPRGLRIDSLSALSWHASDPEIRRHVIDSIVEEGNPDAARRFRVEDGANWKDIAREFVEALQASTQHRSTTNTRAILQAIHSVGTDRYGFSALEHSELADFLIEAALDQDDRMAGILAQLIIDACNRDPIQAGEMINAYENRNKLSPERLEKLRIQVGGPTALKPVIEVLRDNLDRRFHQPIAQLNSDTRKMWQETIRSAQIGFKSRIVMSIIVFAIGVTLLVVSGFLFIFGDLNLEKLFGPSVSFVTGVSMMLAVVYRGPLREIRRSVNDLGIASAAFIAYVHRVLEISHTFSFYYLNEKIDFDVMTNSSELIRDAMRETIGSLASSEANFQKQNNKSGSENISSS